MGKLIGHFLVPHPPIMLPEIGKGEDEKIKATKGAMKIIAEKISNLDPDTIIIITPHGPVFRDAIAISQVDRISGSFAKFGHPELVMDRQIDLELTEEIISNADELGIPVAPITSNAHTEYGIDCELDHGTMVPLYFIDNQIKDYKLVHITYGVLTGYELYKFGSAIQRAVQDYSGNAIVIASGDLSHRLSDRGPYEYNANGPIFDSELTRFLVNGDTIGVFDMKQSLIEGAGECALRSVYVLLGTLSEKQFGGELLSYEGPFGVGYGVMSFKVLGGEWIGVKELDAHRRGVIAKTRTGESVHVKLARESLVTYLKSGKQMKVPDDLTDEMKHQKRGTFVSMKKAGELRGCIGTIQPTTDSVAEEIIRNAIEAGLHDPRFYPVELDEIEDIVFSVDVLGEPERAGKHELDPKRYGVIVSKGGRRGLLLPDLEGVDTVEQQLEIALRKGGIAPEVDYQIERFEVIRYK